MATVESKVFQLLLAKSNAVDAYNHELRQYLLKGSQCSSLIFDALSKATPLSVLQKCNDVACGDELITAIEHLIHLDKIEQVDCDGNIGYQYKE